MNKEKVMQKHVKNAKVKKCENYIKNKDVK